MIEACTAKEGLPFHEHPRTSHKDRRNWLKTHYPSLLDMWDQKKINYVIRYVWA